MNRITVWLVLLSAGLFARSAQAQKTSANDVFLPANLPHSAHLPAAVMGVPHRAVEVNTDLLADAQPGQTLNLRVLDDTALPLQLDYREVHLPGTYSWVGHLADREHTLFVISVVNETAALYLNTGDGREMSLRPFQKGTHLLYQLPPHPEFRCETAPTKVHLPTPTAGFGIQSVVNIDTAIIYTPQAEAEMGGLDAAVSRAVNCVVYTNNALTGSNANTHISLYCVYKTEMDESGTAGEMLSRFRALTFGHNLLNYGALDLITMLVSDIGGGVSGIANMPGTHSLVEIHDRTERTYAHEVGHNLGCGHEPGDQFPNAPDEDRGVYYYSSGHSFGYLSQYFQTIMSYGKSYNGWWIRNFMPRYSNPDVRWESSPGIGGRTGIANDRDNARSLRDFASTVAAYQSVGPNVYVDAASVLATANGSQIFPYHTVAEGMNAVNTGGSVHVAGSRNYNERIRSGKRLFLRSWSGLVTVGRP